MLELEELLLLELLEAPPDEFPLLTLVLLLPVRPLEPVLELELEFVLEFELGLTLELELDERTEVPFPVLL